MRFAAFTSLACTLAFVSGPPAAAVEPTPSEVAAALAAHPPRRVGGGVLARNTLEGQVVVLNFWASWCAPCRKELPRLAALDSELARAGGRVVAVSVDSDPRNAVDFARRHAPGLPVYHDAPDGLARTLDLPALPWTIVLDREGRVAWRGGGADAATWTHIAELARDLANARPVATDAPEGSSR